MSRQRRSKGKPPSYIVQPDPNYVPRPDAILRANRDLVMGVKNMVLDVSEMEAKVREATTDDPWGASSTLMQEIARGTFNFQHLNQIMPCIYSWFVEKEASQWRQIYKALQLLEYLIQHGSERVIDDARSHINMVKMLRNFHYIDDKAKDQGINVRNRAKEIAELLSDVDKIRTERRKAKTNQNKYTGVGNDGGSFSGGGEGRYDRFDSETGGYGGGSGGGYDREYGSSGTGATSSYSGGRDTASDREGKYDEYDAGDWEDTPGRSTTVTPSRSTSINTTKNRPAASSTAVAPPPAKPAPVMNLLDFGDDEPVATVPAPNAPKAPAPPDNEFGDLSSASTAPAAPIAPVAPAAAQPTRTFKTHQGQDLPTDDGPSASHRVTSQLSLPEIISLLEGWGCSNRSLHLNLARCSDYPVGTGGFGDVYSGVLTDGTKIAIKAMRPISADGLSSGKYHKRAAKEIHAWSRCDHRNIAQLLGFAEYRGQLAMISPWADNGTLTSYLAINPAANRCSLSTDVCRGLEYLHTGNIIHGDLKCANVLVSSDGTPMLTDFGNASFTESQVSFTTTATTSFSIRWTAPEILKESNPLSYAGDIYALGMTILEIITGEVPFSQVLDRHLYTVIVSRKKLPNRPEDKIPPRSVCGNLLWSLLISCWVREPRRRPSAYHVKAAMELITSETLEVVESEPESEVEY